MKLTLGFSPCPNDTFIFDALIHHKIDTKGFTFDVSFDDVETLNQKALEGLLAITKLSFHALAHVRNNYALLQAGSALGFGVGPLLICKGHRAMAIQRRMTEDPSSIRVGIPGRLTTANFLLGIAYPQLTQKVELVFSEIEEALLSEHIDLGLIIHENRFTYQDKGLHKITDLGTYWEETTGCAIPLGGIAIHRRIQPEIQQIINQLIRESVEYAFQHPQESIAFIKSHSQAMAEEVIQQHIQLYVNSFSIELGETGEKAIETLFSTAANKGIIPLFEEPLFAGR